MTDQPSAGQRVARVYRHLREGESLTATQIARLLGFRHPRSAHRLMLLLEREDAALVRDAAIDPATDRPVIVWYLVSESRNR